jgi:hypothetical protein
MIASLNDRKPSKNLCTLRSLMTPTNDVSLEIQRRIQAAKWVLLQAAQTYAVEPPFKPDKIHHSQHLNSSRLALRQWDVGFDQNGGELIARIWEEKVLRTICGPKIENGVYKRRYNHELDKKFNSSNALNVTKTSRLRYAGHMIRRPDNLPQKALFRANPIGRRNHQGRPKSRWADGVNSDSLAQGFRN